MYFSGVRSMNTRRFVASPEAASKSNAQTRLVWLSVKYIVRLSGLQASPLEQPTPGITLWAERSVSSRQSEPIFAGGLPEASNIEPDQKRPWRSVLPSLKRLSSISASGSTIGVNLPVDGSKK